MRVHLLFFIMAMLAMRFFCNQCGTGTDVNLVPSQTGYSRIVCSNITCGEQYYQCHCCPKKVGTTKTWWMTSHITEDHPTSVGPPNITTDGIDENNESEDYFHEYEPGMADDEGEGKNDEHPILMMRERCAAQLTLI